MLLVKQKNEQDVAYVLVGNGVEKEKLVDRCKKNNLNNIHFLPPVNKKCVPEALKQADALFITSMKSPIYRYGISMNKIYDYMMASKPILYGIDAKNNDVLDAKCGLKFDDVDSLVKQINTLKKMSKENITQMGQNGHKWVISNCEYTMLADKFLNLLKDGDENE